MEYSVLYDVVDAAYLGNYRDELEKRKDSVYLNYLKEGREKLERTFNSEQLKIIDSYIHTLKLSEEDTDLFTNIKLLHIGIKIGMEMQKVIEEDLEA